MFYTEQVRPYYPPAGTNMNANNAQTLCQVGIAVFSILAILCGYGASHFGRLAKANVPKDANQVVAAPPASATTVQDNRGPTVVATAQNSPGSNPVAVGTLNVNGPLVINPPDPNRDDAIHRKLDAMLALPSIELRRLEQEYTLGFVLVAYSGEIDTTRIAAHTDRIECDWRQCRVFRDDGGFMCVELPHFLRFKKPGTPPFEINGPIFRILLPARPGEKSSDLVAHGIKVRVECLKQEPIGVCAAIGFDDIDMRAKDRK